jgi:hypothetical protein
LYTYERRTTKIQTMKNKKTISTTLLKRVNTAKELVRLYKEHEDSFGEIPSSYGGSTWPSYLEVNLIRTNNQFVYIDSEGGQDNFSFRKRYNVNNESHLDELKYDLSLISRTLKRFLKDNLTDDILLYNWIKSAMKKNLK